MTALSGMDALIRRAAGRPAPLPEPGLKPAGHFGPGAPPGSIGIGRGGTARFAPVSRLDSLDVSNRIRRAVTIARSTTIPQGVDPFA
jgi:hypothetical protein